MPSRSSDPPVAAPRPPAYPAPLPPGSERPTKVHYLHALPRLIDGKPTLSRLGFFARKRVRMDRTFSEVNLAFVFSGTGSLEVEERGAEEDRTAAEAPAGSGRGDGAAKRIRLESPFVLLFQPGYRYRYGPFDADEPWEERYLKFSRDRLDLPLRWKWNGGHFWPMLHASKCRQLFLELEEKARRVAVPGIADQMDLQAEILFLLSRHGEERSVLTAQVRRIHQVEEEIRKGFRQRLDIDALAKSAGFTRRTLFRLFQEAFGASPAEYQGKLRLEEAGQALLESGATISEIAFSLGYRDPLYFSKCFSRAYGLSPREYRQRAGRGAAAGDGAP